MAPTKLPLLNLNCRGEPNPVDDAAGRSWPERRDYFIDLVKASGAWVFTAQECSEGIRADLLDALNGGEDRWGYWANGHVMVWGNKARVKRIAADYSTDLPYPDGGVRRSMVIVRFRVYTPDNPNWDTT